MANQTNSKAKALLGWMDARFPLSKMWNEHLAQYYAPKNFNFGTTSALWPCLSS